MDSKRPSERRNWPCARAGAAELSVLARVRRAVPLAVLALALAGAARPAGAQLVDGPGHALACRVAHGLRRIGEKLAGSPSRRSAGARF
jgi:hypothetical protein